MKCYNISFSTIKNTFHHQCRLLVLFVLIFFITGIVSGFIWADSLSAPAAGQADSILYLSIQNDYVPEHIEILTSFSSNIYSYLNKLSEEHTLTQTQREKLAEITTAQNQYMNSQLSVLQSMSLSASSENIVDDASYDSNFNELFKTAVSVQNSIVGELNIFSNEIATENHLNVRISYLNDSTIIADIYHTHRSVSSRENFFLLTLYCTLVGICFGFFICLCKEAKEEFDKFSNTISF